MCLYNYQKDISYCSNRECKNPFCFRNLNYIKFKERTIFTTSDLKDSEVCMGFVEDSNPYILINKNKFINGVVDTLIRDGNDHNSFLEYIIEILKQELKNSKEV